MGGREVADLFESAQVVDCYDPDPVGVVTSELLDGRRMRLALRSEGR